MLKSYLSVIMQLFNMLSCDDGTEMVMCNDSDEPVAHTHTHIVEPEN